MVKAIEFLIEAIYWFAIFLSPVLGFGAIALIIYANDVQKVELSILTLLIGVIIGIVLAERVRRKYGCSKYISKILATPDLGSDPK